MTVKQMIPYFLVLILVLVGAIYYLNTNQADDPAKGSNKAGLAEPRENSGGMVTLSITYLNPSSSQYRDSLAFQVSMNTHSVDLDRYDLNTLAYLRTANGEVIRPEKWEEAEASGGHHRNGVLLFPKTDAALDKGNFDIIVEDVAEVDQRIFSW